MRRIRIKGVNDMKEYAFGIDLGGTTAKVGLFTTSGKLLEKWEVSTDTSNNGAHILENLAAAVQQKMQEKGLSADEVEGVGLGVPGPVLDSSIVPIVCANLGGWGNRNVSIELSELLGGIRVLVGNDANVAALGEIWMGTAQGCRPRDRRLRLRQARLSGAVLQRHRRCALHEETAGCKPGHRLHPARQGL